MLLKTRFRNCAKKFISPFVETQFAIQWFLWRIAVKSSHSAAKYTAFVTFKSAALPTRTPSGDSWPFWASAWSLSTFICTWATSCRHLWAPCTSTERQTFGFPTSPCVPCRPPTTSCISEPKNHSGWDWRPPILFCWESCFDVDELLNARKHFAKRQVNKQLLLLPNKTGADGAPTRQIRCLYFVWSLSRNADDRFECLTSDGSHICGPCDRIVFQKFCGGCLSKQDNKSESSAEVWLFLTVALMRIRRIRFADVPGSKTRICVALLNTASWKGTHWTGSDVSKLRRRMLDLTGQRRVKLKETACVLFKPSKQWHYLVIALC